MCYTESMKRYTLIDIVQETNPLHATNPSLQEKLYIAVIKDAEQEQPFRLVVENFADPVEAKKEIDAWIAEREAEHGAKEEEARKAQKEQEDRARFEELKTTLLQ